MVEELAPNLGERTAAFVRSLGPAALRGVDLACDFLIPQLQGSSDPRAQALIQTLKAACLVRTATRRRS